MWFYTHRGCQRNRHTFDNIYIFCYTLPNKHISMESWMEVIKAMLGIHQITITAVLSGSNQKILLEI